MKCKKAQHLAVLCHHRWSISILVELHRSGGGKFVTLVNRLRISRDSLRNTVRALTELGWVRRNPGYGHPLRPEYILTRSGEHQGSWCAGVLKGVQKVGVERIASRKWSLPIVYALAYGEMRFSQLRAIWPDLTPRALAMALKELQEADVIERLVVDGYPPATCYRLTSKGKTLATSMTD